MFKMGDGLWQAAQPQYVLEDATEQAIFGEFMDSLRDLTASDVVPVADVPEGRLITLHLCREHYDDVLVDLRVLVPDPDAEGGVVYAWHADRELLRYQLGLRDSKDLRWILAR